MKPDEIFNNLKEICEKLEIDVSEQNFKITGLKVKSGYCTVKGQEMIILDKHKKTKDKARILAFQLKKLPLNDIYIKPAVREYIDKSKE